MGTEVLPLHWIIAGYPAVYPLTDDLLFANKMAIECYHILWE